LRVRRERNEACPGEEACTEGGRIYDERRRSSRPDLPILTICNGCPLLPTKASEQPADLSHWVSIALRLERLKEGGAVYAYPDALTPGEWAAMDALKMARAEDDDHANRDRAEKQSAAAETARIEALRQRR